MRAKFNLFSCVAFILLVIVCWISGSASSRPADPFIGISPQDVEYYKSSSDIIKCKDGINNFTKVQLNDDFCDCADGTDEPGTSACPQGRFYCRNIGHEPLLISSSKVSDGICDCCDGSDEYHGHGKCPNTCWEAGKLVRDRLKKKIAIYQEGVIIRKKEIEQAKVAVAKDEAELSKLKDNEKILEGLVQQLKEHIEQIEKAEEEERLNKEKEKEEAEKERHQESKTAEEKANVDEELEENGNDDKVEIFGDDSPDQGIAEEDHKDALESEGSQTAEVEKHAGGGEEELLSVESKESSDVGFGTGHDAGSNESSDQVAKEDEFADAESLSKEELGRRVASRWTGEDAEKQTAEGGAAEDNHKGHENVQNELDDGDDDDGYVPQTNDENLRYDDNDEELEDGAEDINEEHHLDSSSSYASDLDADTDLSDIGTDGNLSWLEKIQESVRNILQRVNLLQKPMDTSEAANVRKEYEETNAKLSKIQSRISSLTKKLKRDFGPEKEFYSLYDSCFRSKQNQYTYKVCPFKRATQEEGYSKTSLGKWEKFENSYRVMVFSKGANCWNGPDRSLKVKLRCGLKNEVSKVDEPNRCEYVALLSTPAVCFEEKLMELKNKLDVMNKQQSAGHDEL